MKNPCRSDTLEAGSHRALLILGLIAAGALCALAAGEAASRHPVRARNGMVVSADSLASAAGLSVLRQGGNAVDAAVACGFALAATYPEAGNIGGGGFMILRRADGSVAMIDFRETAPRAARRDMYLDAGGNPVRERSLLGPLASGVPGTVAGLLHALETYGTMDRQRVLAPALRCAEEGFPVGDRLAAALLEEWPGLSRFPSTLKVYSRAGSPPREGDTLRQPDLGRTLRLIAEQGREGFYAGPVAGCIIAEMRREGGIITAEDLAGYHAVERAPLRGVYRGFEIVTASPPSGGGASLIQILNFLEQCDLRGMGWNSSRAIHVLASASQRAFADRMAFLGDPDFVPMPLQSLLSKEYAAARMEGWDSLHALDSRSIAPGLLREHRETTHYCTADRWGNVVSVTLTLNELFGCKVIVDGAGFFLNDEMDDFSVKTGASNLYGLVGGEPNAIAPGKRMLSSMTPTIVLRDGKPFLALGARGGSRIPTTTAQIISNVIDFEMNIQEAVDAPRTHHQWEPDTLLYDKRGLVADVLRALGSMGYKLAEVPWTARAQALMIDTVSGMILGGPDPRENGVALGF